jgi:hypothetical protein
MTTASPSVCPECAAPVSSTANSGYCPTCGQAWTRCGGCRSLVSPLWRYCPVDRVETRLFVPSGAVSFASKEPVRVRFDDDVRHPPIARGGYLWTVSTSSSLMRLAPGSTRPRVVRQDRPEYGKGPFAVLPGKGPRRPLVVAVGTRRIALADPGSGEVDPARPSEEKRFSVFSESLPSPTDTRDAQGKWERKHFYLPSASPEDPMAGYPTVAVDQHGVAVLKRRDGKDSLARWQHGGAVEEYALPENNLTGPFTIAGRLCLYSENAFYWLDGPAIKSVPWPVDVEPNARYHGFKQWVQLYGRPPFVALDGVAFLAALVKGLAGGVAVDWPSDQPRFRTFPVPPSTLCQAGPDDRLLLTGGGTMRLLSRSGLETKVAESSSIVSQPALVEGTTPVVCCKLSMRGGLELGSLTGDERVSVPGDCRPIELFRFPGYLVMTAMAGDRVEVLSWPLA